MIKLSDGQLNVIYSLGASVVILGALFKITHWPLPFGITGNGVLGLGLISEALVFILYAFNPPGVELPWERVYPQLADANWDGKSGPVVESTVKQVDELDTRLSEKLDKMLADARIDAGLFDRLKSGIDRFSGTVDRINQSADVSGATQRYQEQLTTAANYMQNINALYALQIEHNKSQNEISQSFIESLRGSATQSQKFNDQITGLASNMENLNRVYGGMLNAMKG